VGQTTIANRRVIKWRIQLIIGRVYNTWPIFDRIWYHDRGIRFFGTNRKWLWRKRVWKRIFSSNNRLW
jgi:hypothetical protein